jgi:hypothetical protein
VSGAVSGADGDVGGVVGGITGKTTGAVFIVSSSAGGVGQSPTPAARQSSVAVCAGMGGSTGDGAIGRVDTDDMDIPTGSGSASAGSRSKCSINLRTFLQRYMYATEHILRMYIYTIQ